MAYKILGFVVWHGGKLLLRRRYGNVIPSRRTAAAGVVGVTVVGLALAASRRDSPAG